MGCPRCPLRRSAAVADAASVDRNQGLGIKAVVAASFARTFYRNAINHGLTIVECPAVYEAVAEGDMIDIDLASGAITHAAKEFVFPQIPESVSKILKLGGLANDLKAILNA